MMGIEQINMEGKRVLIRADLNVPLDEDKKITDNNRIKQFLPTLQYVLEQGGIPIIMSHLGRPGGKWNEEFSLKYIVEELEQLTSTKVVLIDKKIGPETIEITKHAEPNTIYLLENLRFYPEERENNQEFAKLLAAHGDVYINDAFATAHREHASIVSVPKFFKEKAMGLLMEKELDYYKQALVDPKRPLCVILGGAKVSTKLNVFYNIANKADKVIVGGAMANTFLAAQGLQVGRSLYEPTLTNKALEIIGILARRGAILYLPIDVVVAPNINSAGLSKDVPTQEIPPDCMALDIGKATRILYKEALNNIETVLWNGPMGAFEKEEFSHGTISLIESLAACHAFKVVGGGDTGAAIAQMELEHKFDYISTGGSAFLALLEGKDLPAIEALK